MLGTILERSRQSRHLRQSKRSAPLSKVWPIGEPGVARERAATSVFEVNVPRARRVNLDVLLKDMAKYLRDAEIRSFLREPTCESDSNRITYLTGYENWFTGAAMYFRKALPVQCFGVQKLNIYGCPNAETICDESTLGIAHVWVNVPSIIPSSLDNCKSQQAFALELAHAGIIAASKRFEFDLAVFDEAKMSVEDNDYVLSYEIGKSKASPDRKYTAAVFCRYDNRYITELRVMKKDGTLQCLYHFANGNENSIGQLRWDAYDRIRIPLTAVTGDAHWDCYLDGRISLYSRSQKPATRINCTNTRYCSSMGHS